MGMSAMANYDEEVARQAGGPLNVLDRKTHRFMAERFRNRESFKQEGMRLLVYLCGAAGLAASFIAIYKGIWGS